MMTWPIEALEALAFYGHETPASGDDIARYRAGRTGK